MSEWKSRAEHFCLAAGNCIFSAVNTDEGLKEAVAFVKQNGITMEEAKILRPQAGESHQKIKVVLKVPKILRCIPPLHDV